VLTHNLNCLNEFRNPWKSKARQADGKEPTAALLFLDVSMAKGALSRISQIIELPALLREYDSEYHYLFHHVLKFAVAGDQYDYAYMMPNVLRRVLEVFLAFRCPGNAPLSSKIDQLCKAHEGLDKNRIIALERLSQVESHSDNLDDLISFSSMALEEAKDATKALIENVDVAHLSGLRPDLQLTVTRSQSLRVGARPLCARRLYVARGESVHPQFRHLSCGWGGSLGRNI
jgi:hypothetical protein